MGHGVLRRAALPRYVTVGLWVGYRVAYQVKSLGNGRRTSTVLIRSSSAITSAISSAISGMRQPCGQYRSRNANSLAHAM